MKSLLRKHSIILIGTIALFSMLCGGFLFLFHSMKQKETKVQEVKQTLATYEQNKKIFTEETQKLKGLNDRIVLVEQKRITESSVPTFLSSLESIAAQEGGDITITSVQTPVINGKKHLYIDFSSGGSLEVQGALIQRILTMPQQVRFSKFSIHQDSISTDVDGNTVVVEKNNWEALASIEVMSFYHE